MGMTHINYYYINHHQNHQSHTEKSNSKHSKKNFQIKITKQAKEGIYQPSNKIFTHIQHQIEYMIKVCR